MSILGNRVLGGAGQQPYTVGRSLRFRSSATAYLNRTPSVTGSRQKFTWSAWVKRGLLTTGTYYQLFGAGPGAGGNEGIFFDTTAGGLYLTNDGPSTAIITSAVFRDPSAWYHIVCAVDTTQATAANRQIFYINGVQQTSYTGSYCAQNTNFTYINVSGVQHRMGAHTNSGYYFDGYMAEINYVDGQQLTPSSFGFYDNNGVWQPRKYGGTYGTNGFYLPFSSGFNTTQTYAGSFNGSNQFINVASSASLAPGTGDFTVEANINVASLPGTGVAYGVFENQVATTVATSDKFWFGLLNSGGTRYLFMGQHNTANGASTLWTPTVGTWYHIALVRTSGTIKMFINGVEQTVSSSISSGSSFSQNGASFGAASNTGSPSYFNGYISNARYVVGTAVYTSGFTPPSANLTAVTNTQWLTLQNATIIDNSSAARTITNNNSVTTSLQYPFQYTLASIGSDASGNGNNWTPNNINSTILSTTYDSMIDSPTVSAISSNYATLNFLQYGSNMSLSEGNLRFTFTGSGTAFSNARSTIAPSNGKWYFEFNPNELVRSKQAGFTAISDNVGLTTDLGINTNLGANTSAINAAGGNTGVLNLIKNGTTTQFGTYAAADVLMGAIDIDTGRMWFGKNGTWLNSGNPSGGTNAWLTGASGIPYQIYAYCGDGGTTSNGQSGYINFGQRPFTYTPPSGFNALNTYNLPQPTIMNGARVMAATTYTGNGSTLSVANSANNTTGVVFQPDLVWIKSRSNVLGNELFDVIRGPNQTIYSNATNAETYSGTMSSFNTNGFTAVYQASDISTNNNAYTYVGWQWNAGSGTTSTNTNGSISSLVSVNPTAGFSIVSYTGTGAVATVGHGLGVAPNMIIWKNRAVGTENWVVYHSSLGATGNVYLNLTNAFSTDSTTQNNTAPTSSVFTVATSGAVNGSTRNIIAYCWSAVAGYSAFGSYTGNGSSDGPFVYTGFRPRWVMIKNAGGVGNWFICDTSRDTYNVAQNRLFPSVTNAEATSPVEYDILSNGFKIRVDGTTDSGTNTNAVSYIYAAFAENPFKISRAR